MRTLKVLGAGAVLILIALIILAFWSGYYPLEGDRVLPERCTFMVGLYCLDYSIDYKDSRQITFVIENGLGSNIMLKDITIVEESAALLRCQLNEPGGIIIKNGELRNLTFFCEGWERIYAGAMYRYIINTTYELGGSGQVETIRGTLEGVREGGIQEMDRPLTPVEREKQLDRILWIWHDESAMITIIILLLGYVLTLALPALARRFTFFQHPRWETIRKWCWRIMYGFVGIVGGGIIVLHIAVLAGRGFSWMIFHISLALLMVPPLFMAIVIRGWFSRAPLHRIFVVVFMPWLMLYLWAVTTFFRWTS